MCTCAKVQGGAAKAAAAAELGWQRFLGGAGKTSGLLVEKREQRGGGGGWCGNEGEKKRLSNYASKTYIGHYIVRSPNTKLSYI